MRFQRPDACYAAARVIGVMSIEIMDYTSISFNVAEMGLIAAEDHESKEIFIVRPSSIKGTKFKGYDHEYVVGINNVSLKTDAPMAEVSKLGRGKKNKIPVEY